MIKRIFEPAAHTPDADHGPDHEAMTEAHQPEIRYTLEVSFTVDDDADEHIQTPHGIRDEAQSWLESLGAAVATVVVRENDPPAPEHAPGEPAAPPWQEDDGHEPEAQSARPKPLIGIKHG